MIMDQNVRSFDDSTSRINFTNYVVPTIRDNFRVNDRILSGNMNRPISSEFNSESSEGDSSEDFDFSDVVLKYINHILMEEDVEDKTCMFQESAALQEAEKSFYEVLGGHHPSTGDYQLVPILDQSVEFSNEKLFGEYYAHNDVESLSPDWCADSVSVSKSTYSSSSSSSTNGPVDSPVSTLTIPYLFSVNESAMQFNKGVEEAQKFLPSGGNLVMGVKLENKESSRGKKNPYHESLGSEEERSRKQSAVYSESVVIGDMFDKVLLCSQGKNDTALRKELSEVTKNTPQEVVEKTRGKKQVGKRNVVDLRTLLTLCAQAVAADDHRTANEFLKQIRQNATPTGDGMQRLAHYFANGLEARLAGSGTQVYTAHIKLPTSAANILRAYHIYLATCPFKKISNFFANKTIMGVSENAMRVHIIDFGILYGFQWPCFLQRLSTRPGGPPKLRITGIDLPCPGFRPSERVEETGRRLASYAKTFGVPFEFHAIAQKWETIKLEDLKIDKDELLVVNCQYRLRNMLDETVVVNSPRNIVLNLIRRMNPALFVQGIVNGSYNAPFFITRFREALFHYSSLFDMLDANIPREIHERMLLEKIVFGREAMNVIACEGAERIERPETYKLWNVRNMRAGFKQLPLNKEIVKLARNRVKTNYHKDFVIDEDGQWLLQGWKGRIIYALSSWKPAY